MRLWQSQKLFPSSFTSYLLPGRRANENWKSKLLVYRTPELKNLWHQQQLESNTTGKCRAPPARHHWLGEEHFKEFFMGFQRFKSLALLLWSLEDFSSMIQIWMKNGVKKTPLIKRFTMYAHYQRENSIKRLLPKKGQVSYSV